MPTLGETKEARHISVVTVDQQLLGESPGGDSLPDFCLPDVLLPDVPHLDVALPDAPLSEAGLDGLVDEV